VAATVLSICRVMVRQAARTGAGAAIGFTSEEFSTFLEAAKAGEYDPAR
jgi:hypothetical protein